MSAMARFLLIFCLVCAPLLANENRVIVVYGASCSGKSTLSEAIAKEFGALWCVIDRDNVIDRHQNAENPNQHLLEEIDDALKMGLSVVVDTQDPSDLMQSLMPNEPFMVFVYAKIPELIIRDRHRSERKNRTKERAYQARSWVYNTFANLLTIEPGKTPLVDTIEPHELTNDVFIHDLKEYSQRLFHTLAKTSRAVYAKHPCDVIIRSDRHTLTESIQQIKDYYASWKLDFAHFGSRGSPRYNYSSHGLMRGILVC